jgi:N-acetylneuraminic acid mutarotase
MFDSLLDALEKELHEALATVVTGLVTTARTRLEGAVAEVAKERAKGLAEVDAQKADLRHEVQAMHKHKEAQEGHIELNIGGRRFQTSVQTLRRVPHTFFDAYFSGRYAQDVCRDGSIFVDRDGEHFGYVLEYMRDGVVSVAEPGAEPSVSLLRGLKREFGFYCIELVAEQPVVPEQLEMAYVIGGAGANHNSLSSMERYDVSSGQWSAAAATGTPRVYFSACVLAGELYVIGGASGPTADTALSTVEKYSPLSDTWSAVTSLPSARAGHKAVTVGTTIYVLGGALGGRAITASVLKYDSAQEVWSDVRRMPEARVMAAACAVGNDIYVFGGKNQAGLPSTSVHKFDTVANEWSTLAPMPEVCLNHTAALLGGLVYIVGGGGNGNVVLCFDPEARAWSTLAPTSNTRADAASFVLGGRLYVVGGRDHISSSSMEWYDVARDIWTYTASMLEGRRYFGAVTLRSAVGSAEEQDLFDSLIAKSSEQRP